MHREYLGKARTADRKWNLVPPGTRGPLETRLLDYGRIRGFCFGAYGEASGDVKTFVRAAAASGAGAHWLAMGARSAKEARGIITARLTSAIGVTAVREQAALKVARLGLLASGNLRAATARRRNRAFGTRARRNWWTIRSGFAQSGGSLPPNGVRN